jgi:hypothetical protein
MLLLVRVFCFGFWLAAGGVAGKRVLHKVCKNIESFKKPQRKKKKVLVLS